MVSKPTINRLLMWQQLAIKRTALWGLKKKLKTFLTNRVFFQGSSETQVFFSWPYLDQYCAFYTILTET